MSAPTRTAAWVAAGAAAVVLQSCGASPTAHDDTTATTGQPTSVHPTATTPAPDAAGPFNTADVAFASNMIPHHEQAIELSALVPDRSVNPEVIELARAIANAQQPEIDTMNGWLVQWGQQPDPDADHRDMAGMVDAGTMAKLASLNGEQFDNLWIQSMISHHQGAIDMAETEIDQGAYSAAIAMARDIITAQQSEVDQMKRMLGTSSSAAPVGGN